MTVLKTVVVISAFITTLSLLQSKSSANGAVVLTPSPRVEVCHVGDRVQVMCNVTNSTTTVLQWNLNFTSEFGMTTHLNSIISINTMHDMIEVLDSILFTFIRSSELRLLPLVSTLIISPLKNSLNGTRIGCSEGLDGNLATTASTTVFIVGNNPDHYHPRTPTVHFKEYFGTFTITIQFNWENEHVNTLVTYHVYVIPSNDTTIISTSNTRANVTVSYNTPYNVSVVANFCGQSDATANVELNYVNCGNPFDEEIIENATLVVTGYQAPALEGTIINFTCINGHVLTGRISTTCMSNGHWKPHPREAKCKVNCNLPSPPSSGYIVPYTSSLEGANITYIISDRIHFTATCNNKGNWELNLRNICTQPSVEGLGRNPLVKIAIGFSVTVFVASSVLFFVVGFACGHFCQKHENHSVETIRPLEDIQTTPLYDVILPKDNNQEMEIKTNVAYGTVSQK